MLAALAQRQPIEQPVAVVVAHPDDETVALGGSLHLFRRLLLVHVTDGAPRRLGDAAREGFATPEAYAAARARELEAALALSGAAPERAALGVPDQDAVAAIAEIAERLRALFRAHDVRHVLTHAYEGGHPDHDAVALSVHLAGAPEVIEFPLYHARPEGGLAAQRFIEATFTPALSRQREREIRLTEAEIARKRAMTACFQTQAAILSQFDATTERFRPVPEHDWTAPPHAGRLLYEEWGWMTGSEWRKRAADAIGAARCVV